MREREVVERKYNIHMHHRKSGFYIKNIEKTFDKPGASVFF
jgi:hypothetical protein